MLKDKALDMLGMAARAGKAAGGEFSVEKAVKAGRAFLVLLSEDASDNTKKKFRNMCSFYQVPCVEHSTKAELGHAIGRQDRTAVAVLDEGLAKAVESHLQTKDSSADLGDNA